MNIITLDFETYYSQEFSLTKVTNEEYVRSAEFEVIGVSVQVDNGEPEWFTGTMAETAVPKNIRLGKLFSPSAQRCVRCVNPDVGVWH